MTAPRRFMAVAMLALVLSAAAGCAHKATAPKPVPDDTAADSLGVPLATATSPDSLLATMATAVATPGTAGARAWARAFCDSSGPTTPAYHAFADPGLLDAWVSDGHALPATPMDLTLERRTFGAIRTTAQAGTLTLTWTDDFTMPADVIDLGAGTALLHRIYFLEFAPQNGQQHSVLAAGAASLDCLRKDGLWQVRTWNDRGDPSLMATALVKARLTLSWWRLLTQAP